MKLEATRILPGPPDRVWEILVDWERQASWMPDVAWIRVVGPDRGLGTRLLVRTKVFGVPLLTDRLRVTRWEPPSRLTVAHEGLVRGIGDWRLGAAAPGLTRFVWAEHLRLEPAVIGELALWVYSPWHHYMLRRAVANLGERLKRTNDPDDERAEE
jgi:hypothetical protein